MLYTLRFFSLQNAVYFIMLTCLLPVLFTFYIQGVLKLKKKIPAPKGYLFIYGGETNEKLKYVLSRNLLNTKGTQ